MTDRSLPGKGSDPSVQPIDVNALLAAMDDFVMVIDADGRYLWMAPTQVKDVGEYVEHARQLRGRTIHSVLPDNPEQADAMLACVRNALAKGETEHIEYRATEYFGERWYSATVSPMGDDRVVWVARDITDRVFHERSLEEQVGLRTRELTTLLEVSRVVASSLDLGEVLGSILDQLGTITEHTGASILLISDDAFEFVEARSITGRRAQIGARVPFAVGPGMAEAVKRGEIVIIDDVRAEEPMAADYRAVIRSIGQPDQPPFNVIRSWMAVPLALKERVLGALTISWTVPSYFTADHARLARAFADQAALALENARLFDSAQRLAAVEERQRLARELHDSVSQALYGIALGARTARRQLDRDPAEAVEPMDYVLSLAEAGLAEMRSLIFELRPESLESEGLVAALNKQIDAASARYGLEIEAKLAPEPDLPIEAKEALYRIAQEALHNIAKHAGATRVTVSLDVSLSGVVLTITDDGRGFDPEADYAGHLGLRSMRERAEQRRGSLTIESGPGDGTRILVMIPAAR